MTEVRAEMPTQSLPLWEILVPTVRNDGRPIRLRFHKVWDAKVKELTGGMTVIKPVQGTWVSEEGDEYKERMIPVRIMCSRETAFELAEFSKKYYEQLAIMLYKVSEEAYVI